MTDWLAVCERNARSVQTLIGWIFWDPGAVERFTALGLPGPLGYIASRAAPLAPAGDDAVTAAFMTIHPRAVRAALERARASATWEQLWAARDEAVLEGLHTYVGEHVDDIAALSEWLWEAVAACPLAGRAFFGAHLRMARTENRLLSAWHAVNCLREWRGDTHMALLVEADLDPVGASLLHSAWVGYPHDWIARSRGWNDEEIATGFATLAARGLAARRGDEMVVTGRGVEMRQHIEDRTNELTTTPWRAVGAERSMRFATILEAPCEALLSRVDETAGPRYMPGSRIHRPG